MARAARLRIAYPGIMQECERAMLATLARTTGRVPAIGCTTIHSYGKHRPCLLPQHGPGKKHDRPIVLPSPRTSCICANAPSTPSASAGG